MKKKHLDEIDKILKKVGFESYVVDYNPVKMRVVITVPQLLSPIKTMRLRESMRELFQFDLSINPNASWRVRGLI